jgi:hypothetical protein
MRASLYFFLLISILWFTGCGGPGEVNSLVVRVDGQERVFSNIRGTSALGEIVISGEAGELQILLMFGDTLREGIYQCNEGRFVMTCSKDRGENKMIVKKGVLKLLRHRREENSVAGTFDVIMGKEGETKNCRLKGAFSIRYEEVTQKVELSFPDIWRSQKRS